MPREYFILEKDFRFEAAHRIPNHQGGKGKCARLHGHSWKGIVAIEGYRLNNIGSEQGMLVDFDRIKQMISGVLEEKLDHHYLNETLPVHVPTSENIARWLYQHFKNELYLINAELILQSVTIEETCTARCRYMEESI